MYKSIEYEYHAILSIEKYIRQYREYFEGLYSDTGLVGEQEIIHQYRENSRSRKDEIFSLIEHRLSPDIVHGRTPNNTLLLPWRSKTLFVAWIDEGETRIVTELIIR